MRLCLRSAANGMVRLLPDPHVHSCQPAALPFVYTGFGRCSRIGSFLRRSAAGSVFRCSGTVLGRIVFTICRFSGLRRPDPCFLQRPRAFYRRFLAGRRSRIRRP